MPVDYTRRVPLIKRGIYFTADVVTPDDTDTNAYGEPCEPGYGYKVESGWLDPNWSLYDVSENRHDAQPDTYESARDGDARAWLASRLAERLNGVEFESFNEGDTSIYERHERETDYRTGQTTRVTAHPYGFEPWEVASALERLREAQRLAA